MKQSAQGNMNKSHYGRVVVMTAISFSPFCATAAFAA